MAFAMEREDTDDDSDHGENLDDPLQDAMERRRTWMTRVNACHKTSEWMKAHKLAQKEARNKVYLVDTGAAAFDLQSQDWFEDAYCVMLVLGYDISVREVAKDRFKLCFEANLVRCMGSFKMRQRHRNNVDSFPIRFQRAYIPEGAGEINGWGDEIPAELRYNAQPLRTPLLAYKLEAHETYAAVFHFGTMNPMGIVTPNELNTMTQREDWRPLSLTAQVYGRTIQEQDDLDDRYVMSHNREIVEREAQALSVLERPDGLLRQSNIRLISILRNNLNELMESNDDRLKAIQKSNQGRTLKEYDAYFRPDAKGERLPFTLDNPNPALRLSFKKTKEFAIRCTEKGLRHDPHCKNVDQVNEMIASKRFYTNYDPEVLRIYYDEYMKDPKMTLQQFFDKVHAQAVESEQSAAAKPRPVDLTSETRDAAGEEANSGTQPAGQQRGVPQKRRRLTSNVPSRSTSPVNDGVPQRTRTESSLIDGEDQRFRAAAAAEARKKEEEAAAEARKKEEEAAAAAQKGAPVLPPPPTRGQRIECPDSQEMDMATRGIKRGRA